LKDGVAFNQRLGYCGNQIFRTCSDIAINQSEAETEADYVPNPVPPPKPHPAAFSCNYWQNSWDRGNGSIVRNTSPDLNQYKGSLFCFMSEEDFKSTSGRWQEFMTEAQYNQLIPHAFQSKEDLIHNWYLRNVFCPNCRVNCQSPDKTCPSECYCRWYMNPL